MNRSLLGIVLCGGRSLRMGTNKALLAHRDGGTFVDHAMRRLEQLRAERLVAEYYLSGIAEPEIGYPMIQDAVRYRGPATGVAAAVELAKQKGLAGCLVTPVDMPALTARHLKNLVVAWQGNPDQLTCAENQSSHSIEPLVTIYPVSFSASLQQLSQSSQRSLYRWIERYAYQVVTISGEACRNINRPEDLDANSGDVVDR